MSEAIEHDWVGRTVECKAVGQVPQFTGVVETAWYNSGRNFHGVYFHVRNLADGTVWHREFSEVRLCERAPERVPA